MSAVAIVVFDASAEVNQTTVAMANILVWAIPLIAVSVAFVIAMAAALPLLHRTEGRERGERRERPPRQPQERESFRLLRE